MTFVSIFHYKAYIILCFWDHLQKLQFFHNKNVPGEHTAMYTKYNIVSPTINTRYMSDFGRQGLRKIIK